MCSCCITLVATILNVMQQAFLSEPQHRTAGYFIMAATPIYAKTLRYYRRVLCRVIAFLGFPINF